MERHLAATKFEYHIFTTNDPALADRTLFERLYNFWHKHWLETFHQLVGMEKLYSDDFHRHEYKTFLTYENQIIAYFAFNRFDLSLNSHREHSYFKSYPPAAMKFLDQNRFKKVMAMGYLCAAPEWRKSASGGLVADSILRLVYRRFAISDSEALIAFTRNDRAVNNLVYNCGSKCMVAGVKRYNIDVDFIYTMKQDIRDSKDLLVRSTVNRLWKETIFHTGGETSQSRQKAA